MNTHRIGLRFESELKKKLNDAGLICLNLGYNEIGDLVVVNGKTRIIECKTTHKPYFYLSKNPYQSGKLKELALRNISVYYAVKFIKGNKSRVDFYYMNMSDQNTILREYEGYSFTDFVKHCKLSNKLNIYTKFPFTNVKGD
jgi:Holliday junction resolvase